METHPCSWIGDNIVKVSIFQDFPGGPVVKNPPPNAGDEGSIPGRGTKIPHVMGQLSLCPLEPAPQLESLRTATTEPVCSGACKPQIERSPCVTTKDPACPNEDPA